MFRFNPSERSGNQPTDHSNIPIGRLGSFGRYSSEMRQSREMRSEVNRLTAENGNLRSEQSRLTLENAELRSEMSSLRREVRALKAEHSGEARRDQYQRERQQEAKADYDQQVRPQLQVIRRQIGTISDEQARDGCHALIVRIDTKVEHAQNTSAAADPALILDIFDDYALLIERIDAAPAADEHERKLLATLGERLKGHLAVEVWSVLSKLGRLRQWTAEGEVSVGIFGVAKGSARLGITFERE